MATVLVVDDSLSVRKVIERALEARQIKVVSAALASEALDRLDRHSPDLVVSDIILPDKDGYHICASIRSHPRLAGIPVLLISGIVNDDVVERAAAAGSSEVLRKPFTAEALAQKVSDLLARPPSAARQLHAPNGAAGGGPALAGADPALAADLAGEGRPELLLDLSRPPEAEAAAVTPSQGDPGPEPGFATPSEEAAWPIQPEAAAEIRWETPAPPPIPAPETHEAAPPGSAGVAPASAGPGGEFTGPSVIPMGAPSLAAVRPLPGPGMFNLGQFTAMSGVDLAVLVDREGFVIDAAGTSPSGRDDAEVAGALAACLAEASDGIARELGRGALSGVILEYKDGIVLLHGVGPSALLALLVREPSVLGKVRYFVRKALPDLAAAL